MVKLRNLIILLTLLMSYPCPGKDIVMKVDGLACAFCAYGLEKKLKKLKGVENVDISLNKGIVILKIKEGVEINPEILRRLVREAGFVLKEVKVK